MADVTPKFKLYIFLSIVVLLLNLSIVVVDGFNGINSDFVVFEKESLPIDYKNMSYEERDAYLSSIHKGKPLINYYTEKYVYPDGTKMTFDYHKKYVSGQITQVSGIDYSKSSDTSYVTKVAGISGLSFIPFASILVSALAFQNAFPINIIIGIIVSIVSVLQTLLIIAIILNQLPFFNT